MRRNSVIILDPRGTIARGGNSVIERHKLYAQILNEISPKSKLLIISKSYSKGLPKTERNQLAPLEIENIVAGPFFLFRFFIKSRRVIRSKQKSRVVLIAGDPWISFYITQVIRCSLRPFPRVQLQIHGDIFDKKWRDLSLRNHIKSELARISIRSAANIRVNTEIQSIAVSAIVNSNLVSVTVAPVPFSVPGNFVPDLDGRIRPRSIGFVGRLHPERGTSEFVNLIKSLPVKQMDLDIYIVGEGNDRAKLEDALTSAVDGHRIYFLGNLSGPELEQAWQKIGVSIFTAPSESFGLAIRESLIRGIPVWTFPTVGAIELVKSLGKESTKIIRVIDGKAHVSELESWLEESLNSEVPKTVKSRLLLDRRVGLQKLVESWIK